MQFNTVPHCFASVQQCYFYFLITPQYTRRLVGAIQLPPTRFVTLPDESGVPNVNGYA